MGAEVAGAVTTGGYHDPMTPWVRASGVIGVVMTLGLVVLLARVTDSFMVKFLTGCLTVSMLTAVSGLWLPYLHTDELDIGSAGFDHPYYSMYRDYPVTIYNATSLPMTICVGTGSHCTPAAFAPAQLNGGLQIAPGQAVDVVLGGDEAENDVPMPIADWAAYTLTIATPSASMTRIDIPIHALRGCADFGDPSSC
jgi:hypothetical protein